MPFDPIAYINEPRWMESRLGLDRIRELLDRLGRPQDRLKFVHVAGTNGKGSTCAYLASILQAAGLRTGLFTSPYLITFEERIRVDGVNIALDQLAEVALLVKEQAEAMTDHPTEFELMTAVALVHFARQGCDIVVLEVGMGGRFDATNVIDVPEAAAIMSISLDHTAILGDTLEKIAFEKAGIVKEGGRLVLYPDQAPEVARELTQICKERQVELVVPDLAQVRELESSMEGTTFQLGERVLRTPFLGEHQVKNAVTAWTVVEVLKGRGWAIDLDAAARGFGKAFVPARMEVISREPLCLLDGGHNPGCAKALREALEQFVPQRKVAIVGMMSDKDSHGAFALVGPLFDEIITVAPQGHRSMPAQELAKVAAEFCPKVIPAGSCREALAVASRAMGEDAALIVCGSFYLAGDIREMLLGKFGKK